jgi:hypothetical protein
MKKPFNNPYIHHVLIGTLLGDASLQTYTGYSWRARFLQSNHHKDYLFHLYDIFKIYVKTPPRESDDGHGNSRWSFNTTVVPELSFYADLFYSNNKKLVTPLISEHFNDVSLAYWFMDDGSLKRYKTTQAFILCTDSFSKDQVIYLGDMLKLKYNIHVNYHKQRDNYRIYIPSKHFKEFRSLILPYTHPIFYYKLGDIPSASPLGS